jgi:hypothetical protein
LSDKTCPKCGAALMPGDIFCGECGVRVREADYSAEEIEEILKDEPLSISESTAAESALPPPAVKKRSRWTTARIISVVLAVSLLLGSLCLCSLGGFALIPTESTTLEEDLGFATVLCFAPGVISGLLGAGAAYFGIRRK